jgi:hypothetical protein
MANATRKPMTIIRHVIEAMQDRDANAACELLGREITEMKLSAPVAIDIMRVLTSTDQFVKELEKHVPDIFSAEQRWECWSKACDVCQVIMNG